MEFQKSEKVRTAGTRKAARMESGALLEAGMDNRELHARHSGSQSLLVQKAWLSASRRDHHGGREDPHPQMEKGKTVQNFPETSEKNDAIGGMGRTGSRIAIILALQQQQ